MALSNWQRQQLLKRNAVVVRFEDLNPGVQGLIRISPRKYLAHKGLDAKTHGSIRAARITRGIAELGMVPILGGLFLPARPELSASEVYSINGALAALALSNVGLRTIIAKRIQKIHQEIAEKIKQAGLLKPGNPEKNYPPEWINPTIVAETHPIFSVRGNGDMVFRRATRLEFKLLKIQEGWRGKVGLNASGDVRKLIWRWRGTLRRPKAPEVERKRASEWLKARLSSLRPIPLPTPVLKPIQKMVWNKFRKR